MNYLAMVGDLSGYTGQRLSTYLAQLGWIPVQTLAGGALWTHGGLRVTASPYGRGWVMGELFRRSDGRPFGGPTVGAVQDELLGQSAARRLCHEGWGGYVALWLGAPGEEPSAWRDPSGSLEALSWTHAGLTFVTSSLAAPGVDALLPRVRPDWSRVEAFLADGGQMAGELGLEGVDAVAAGEWRALNGAAREQIWTPAAFVRDGAEWTRTQGDDITRHAAQTLSATIDRCAAAYGRLPGTMLMEVSGGLDSAVIACALRRERTSAVAQWINIHPQDGVGDERGFARLVAARLGVELTEASKPEVAFDREAVLALSKGARPGVNGMDPDYDAELASRARASGAWAIMTGQGGDEIFFASRCPAIAAEIRPGAGWLALADPRMHGLARWTRTSVWSLMRTRRRTLRPEAFASPLTGTQASRLGGPSLSHPWLADLNGLAPAKREQIGFLARSLLHHGECLRGSAARLVHGPLLQPTVELCLALPASVLTLCLRDRALVRRAFADRLPSEIVHRRGKGDLNAYYGRMLARSLWWIRPFLLEGVLAVRGLIDRNVLDDRLHPDDMAWRGEVADLIDLMAIEAWARTWSSRTPSSLGPLTP